MHKRASRAAAAAALPLLLALLIARPQGAAAQGLLLGDQLGATPSLGRLLDGGAAAAGAGNAAATRPAGGAGGLLGGPGGVSAAGASARGAGARAPAPAPSGSADAASTRQSPSGSSAGGNSAGDSPAWSPSPSSGNAAGGSSPSWSPIPAWPPSPASNGQSGGSPTWSPSPFPEILVPSPPPYLPSFTPVQAASPPSPAAAVASPPQSWGGASPSWGVASAQSPSPTSNSPSWSASPPSPVQAAESYPRCGADACNAPLPTAYEGSEKFGNLTFTVQLSANANLMPFGQAQAWAVGNATLALLLPVIGAKSAAVASVEALATDKSNSGVQTVRAQVDINSTKLYLPTMLAVLQQTSQNRQVDTIGMEFLNRLRAFGLNDLIDAYLTSIATSDGSRVGGTDGSGAAQAPAPVPATQAAQPPTQDQSKAAVQAPGGALPAGQPLAPAQLPVGQPLSPAQQPAGQTATAPAQQTTGQPLAPAQLPAGQAAGAPAPAALPTRLVPSRTPAAISLAPAAAASGGQAMTPTAATQLVPGIVQGTIAAQAPGPAAAQPSWGEPVPVQTPTSGVSLTLALVGPNSAALTPSDRAAIQAAMAQAIPGITPDQVVVGPPNQAANAAGTRNLLQSAPPTTVYTIQVLPGAGNAAAVATQVSALARRPADQLLQLLRAKGLDVSGVAITSVDGVPVTGATDGPVASTGAAPIQAPRIVTVPQPAMPDWAYPFTPVTDLPSAPVQAPAAAPILAAPVQAPVAAPILAAPVQAPSPENAPDVQLVGGAPDASPGARPQLNFTMALQGPTVDQLASQPRATDVLKRALADLLPGILPDQIVLSQPAVQRNGAAPQGLAGSGRRRTLSLKNTEVTATIMTSPGQEETVMKSLNALAALPRTNLLQALHARGLEITDAHVTAVNGVPVPDDAFTMVSPIAPAGGPVSGPVSGSGQPNSAQAGSGPSPAKLTYIVAGAAAGALALCLAAWLFCCLRKRCSAERQPPPSPIYITESEVRKDSALRRIGSPVGRASGRDRAAASTINPMARAFSASAARAGRGRDKGGLLSGHVSSTEAAMPGTPPKTAAEALAAMQSRLAAESPSSGPVPTDFSTFKAPEIQKPWAKPAGNPRSGTPPRAASETARGGRVPSSAKNTHGGGNARRHSITASLPADMGMEDVTTNPMVATAAGAAATREVDPVLVATNPISLMDSGLSVDTRRSKSPRSPRAHQPASPVASDLEAISSAGISRIRRMASDTQESLDRLGSPAGTPRSGTPRRRDPSPQHFSNPMLTTSHNSGLLISSAGSSILGAEVMRTPQGTPLQTENMANVQHAVQDILDRGDALAGKYMLQQAVVAGQATITCGAQEKLFPNRAALCHFYVDAADFDRERRLLERLTPGPGAPSKHVPAVLDAFERGEIPGAPHLPPCLITDTGDYSLAEWPSKRARNPDEVQKRAVLAMVVKALAGLHSAGVAHCALSPSTVLWYARDNAMKLAGLDSAAAPGTATRVSPALRYAPPEVIAAAGKRMPTLPASCAIDMWSLGAIAYEIFAGQPLFGNEVSPSDFATMMAGKAPLPWEGTRAPALGRIDNPDARTLICGLLRRNAAERWQMRQVLGCALFRPPSAGAAAGATPGPAAAVAAPGGSNGGSAAAAQRSAGSVPAAPSARLVSTMPSPRRRTTSEGARSLEEAALHATAHLSSKRAGH